MWTESAAGHLMTLTVRLERQGGQRDVGSVRMIGSPRLLRSAARIQPGEGCQVAIMIVYSAAAVGGVWTIGFNGISQTLFLSRLPASDVPFTFILPAIAILVLLTSYAWLASHFSLTSLTAGSSVFLLL